MLTSWFTRPIATARPQTPWPIALAALLVLASDAAAAPQLPARVVVLDERSPHVELAGAVRDAFADELAAVAGAIDPSLGDTSSNAEKDQGREGILKRLTRQIIGSGRVPTVRVVPTLDEPKTAIRASTGSGCVADRPAGSRYAA